MNTKEGGNYYLFYPKENSLAHVIQNGGAIKKMNAVFDGQAVLIEHPKLGLKLTLTLLPQ